MAGIYIHIPFCRKACHYCNFHFSTTHHQILPMLASIEKEAELQKEYLTENIRTVYFGGGTPSILSIESLEKLMICLRKFYSIEADAEITLETNPDDIHAEKLEAWKRMGINRLSIGIQSFSDQDLLWMNRAHSAEQAIRSIELARAAGFDNITIDLIYGTPALTDEVWKINVQKALSFGIDHLSCYALTVEPKTGLEKMIAQKKMEAVDPEKQARHFTLLMQWLLEAGFEHYEISNFAKPGKRSKHNSNYWTGTHYLGLGPSAHSFNGQSRQWNIANNALYIQSLTNNKVPFEIEILSKMEQLNEYIMTSLRTMEGLSLHRVRKGWGEKELSIIMGLAKKSIDRKYLILENEQLVLTNSGKLMADGIASDLFFV
ncbi:MAG: radical SAM family heme chaperone HemW [Chitinophagaceae bacterium]|nr:radical SAM family heme chaperone HemW [Chitinophagaceae bacterium]